MGLDNGFYVRSRKRTLTREDLPSTIEYPWSKGTDLEIVYWRKYWGLRTEICCSFPYDDYHITFNTPEEVKDLIKIIRSWMDPERWEDEGNSIWSYDQARPNLEQSIINLSAICEFMKNNPDIYLDFYDSY